jgi:hypothetical protein
MPSSAKADKFCTGLCVFFMVLGAFSRVFIYAKGQNLWFDEAKLWESIKPFIGNFECSEFALRFLPLLAGIATILFAYIFAVREFGVRFACIFLFLLASSDTLLFYSLNFSLYGFEALVMVICLCLWSFSEKNKSALILLISVASIFCIACNYSEANIYRLKAEEIIQMLGRHFINFHYFVFGKLVWINALLFVLPFCVGSVFLYRDKEKRVLLIAVFAAIIILLLFYFLKIASLGMPYDNFMRIMRNWSQMQVVGSKHLTFILPLVFIPVAFFIHRIFLRIGTATLISVLCIFALIATSSNFIRIHKGIGSPQSFAVLQQINESANTRSLIFADSVSRPILEYYLSQSPLKDNANLNYFAVKNNGYMYLNDSIFIGKYGGRTEELFDIMKNFEAENGFFFFTYSSFYSISESNKLFNYVQTNYNGKSKGFQAWQTGAAWVRF